MNQTEHAWKHVLNEALADLGERDVVERRPSAGDAVESLTGPITVTFPTIDADGVTVDTYEMRADTVDGVTVYGGFANGESDV